MFAIRKPRQGMAGLGRQLNLGSAKIGKTARTRQPLMRWCKPQFPQTPERVGAVPPRIAAEMGRPQSSLAKQDGASPREVR